MKNSHKALHKELCNTRAKRFAVDQVLSVSGYNLDNGRIPCEQKY